MARKKKPADPIDRYLARSRRRLRRRILIGMIIAAVLAGGSYYYFVHYRPQKAYDDASDLYETKSYVQAIDAFQALGDYQDSRERYEQTVKELVTSYCQMQDYEKARSAILTYDTEEDLTPVLNESVKNYVEARCAEHDYATALNYAQYGDTPALQEYITEQKYLYVKEHAGSLTDEQLSILKELADADYKDSLYYLGRYYEKKGNDAETKRLYRKYLYSHPDSEYKKKIEKAVSRIEEEEDQAEIRRVMDILIDRWDEKIYFDEGTIRFNWVEDTMVSAQIDDAYGKRSVPVTSYDATTVVVNDSEMEATYTVHYYDGDKYSVDLDERNPEKRVKLSEEEQEKKEKKNKKEKKKAEKEKEKKKKEEETVKEEENPIH